VEPVSWISNIKLRLIVGGPVLIVLGLVLYLARGVEATLALVAIGMALLIAGVLYKPSKKKTKNVTNDAPQRAALSRYYVLK
jgi:uncharacterized membrane protein HdeD (DUF308 family)